MRLRTIASGAVTALLLSAPIIAVSNPPIEGTVSGIELCPQFICGEALFAGTFDGTVKGKPASGTFWAGINHTALPTEVGESATITGGTWTILARRRVFSGPVQNGGSLTLNPDGITFTVILTMELATGGSGTLSFTGILDHGTFPPGVYGTVSQ